MGLSVITLNAGNRQDLLTRCIKSVEKALPFGAVHKVIYAAPEDFDRIKFEAAMSDEYTAFIDDDDYVTEDSIKQAYDAILYYQAGISFTREVTVNLEGKDLQLNTKSRISYDDIVSHPRSAHHLVIVRSDQIHPTVLDMHNIYGAGLDWFIIATAALNGRGAIHVPIDGYFWTIHTKDYNQKSAQTTSIFNKHIWDMEAMIKKVVPPISSTPIPKWVINSAST